MALDQEAKEQFTIILPTLNEAVNIGLMIETLNKLYPSSNIMVVDDSSTDGTADDARKYSDYAGRIKVIVRDPSDRGLTASVMDGIRRTKTKYFIVLDADFQHPPEDIQKMMDQLVAGKQLAIGVREDKVSLSSARKIASEGAHAIAKGYLAVKGQPRPSDTMSGFFGGDTALFQDVVEKNGSKFEKTVVSRYSSTFLSSHLRI